MTEHLELNTSNGATLPRGVQKLLNWFLFFLAFPSLIVVDNSVTFYIFIVIVYKVGIYWVRPFKGKILFFSFLFVVVASTFLGLFHDMERHPGFFYTIQIIVQYTYWILLAAFMIIFRGRIDLLQLSKWLFFGTIASIVGFYLVPFKLDLAVVTIITNSTRNSFIFSLLCTIPLSFLYLRYKYTKIKIFYFILFFGVTVLFTNGRSGAVIILVQLFLIASIIYPVFRRIMNISILPLVFMFFLIQSDGMQVYLNGIASQVESINPRFANLLRAEGDGDLTIDKSWLIRKLMIDKGFEIIEQYPFLGIGANNFKYFDSELATYEGYERLGYLSTSLFNSRSAHNSYVQILAEFGIIGFIFFILILLQPILFLFRKIFTNKLSIYDLPLISLIGLCLHFYAIASITGAIPWFIFGLCWSISNKIKR
ncbi:MAG: O-antigen ligase family protein [Bacteroidota bacterium]